MLDSCFRQLAILGLAALALPLFVGCPTPSKAPPRVTPLGQAQPVRTPPPKAVIEQARVNEQPALPARVIERPEAVLPEEKVELPFGFLPVSQWFQVCGFEEVKASADLLEVDLLGRDSRLSLAVNNRFARWNGMHIALGFIPQQGAGELTVHSLDVVKTIHPLLNTLLVPRPDNPVVVIDPGHGGKEPGSKCVGLAIYEKDMALDWALRVERLLRGSRWKVVLTRREDRDLTLQERIAIADNAQADLFISLHFNSLPQNAGAATEAGIETYCLTPVGAKSTLVREFEDDPRRVFANNAFDAENLVLAVRMHASLLNASGRKDRGVRRARFMTVLREQKRPAVLLEGGYLSHPTESQLILQEEFREKLAQAVVNGLPRDY